MYVLAKFQPDMPITLRVMALKSDKNKKIDLYSKHRENKLQALTKVTWLTKGMSHKVVICIIMFAMNKGIYY